MMDFCFFDLVGHKMLKAHPSVSFKVALPSINHTSSTRLKRGTMVMLTVQTLETSGDWGFILCFKKQTGTIRNLRRSIGS